MVISTWGNRPFRTYNWNVPTIQGFIHHRPWCLNHLLLQLVWLSKYWPPALQRTVSTGQSGGRTLWRYGFLCVLVAALLRSSISPSRVGSNGFQVAEYDQVQVQYISRWLQKIVLCSSTFGELRNILIFQLGWNYHPIWMMFRIRCTDPFKMTCRANGVHTWIGRVFFPTAKGWRTTTRWWLDTYFSVYPFFGEMILFTHAVLSLLPKGAAYTTWIMHLLLGESYGGYDRGRESWIGRRDFVQVFMEGTYITPHCMESYLHTCQYLW